MTTSDSPTANDPVSNDLGDHDCQQVLARVYEFLDHELDDASGDAIRSHLAACEPCLDRFDVEQAMKSLVSRCCGNDKAPDQLREKVLRRISELSDS